MTTDRLNRLLDLLDFEGLNALALNPGPTLTYLTGLNFHLMERPTVLLVAHGTDPVLILPELEQSKALTARLPLRTFTYSDNPLTWDAAFLEASQALQLNGRLIGLEPNRMRYLELSFLQRAAPEAGFRPAEHAVSALRLQKDAAEIEAMRQAARIAETALQATLPCVRVGMTERQLASELVIQLLRAGSDSELPFAPIVAFGPNSANPHSVPGDRPLQAGDLLLFDWGAAYRGYISDITRTFAVGAIDPELEAIYRAVQAANAAGRAAGKPGLPAGQVDNAARQVITAAGYGPYFTHRVGHGIGMEGHEPPYMYAGNPLLLEVGMAYTVEPGIYLPGRGGVRIEDDLVITPTGSESLTALPRELVVLPTGG
jgi:Xaa-Pro dipeptidase